MAVEASLFTGLDGQHPFMSPAAIAAKEGLLPADDTIQTWQSPGTADSQNMFSSIPSELTCPITQELLSDPVILNESGHSYERSAIQQWLYKGNRTDPLTGAAITSTNLSTNWALKKVINAFLAASSAPASPCNPTTSRHDPSGSTFMLEDSTAPSLLAGPHQQQCTPSAALPSSPFHKRPSSPITPCTDCEDALNGSRPEHACHALAEDSRRSQHAVDAPPGDPQSSQLTPASDSHHAAPSISPTLPTEVPSPAEGASTATGELAAGVQRPLGVSPRHTQEDSVATVLHEAASKGNTEAVQQLLALQPEAIDMCCDPFGTTPLHAAALGGWHQVVEMLLDHGADPLACDRDDSRVPLHVAACMGHADVLHALLRREVPTDIPDRDGATALVLAAKCGQAGAAKVLMAAGADWAVADAEGLTAMHHACSAGDERTVAALLQGGCPANLPMHNTTALPPLTVAVMQRAEAVARLLLDAGAEVDAIDCQQCNALLRAVHAGELHLLRLLVERGADVGALCALGAGVRLPHLSEALPVLLKSPLRARVLRGDPRLEWSPLLDAVQQGDKESLQLLLQQAWPEQCSDVFSAALCEAVARGDAAMVETLAESGRCWQAGFGFADNLLDALARIEDAAAGEAMLQIPPLQQHLRAASSAAVHAAVVRGVPELARGLIKLGLLDVKVHAGEDERTVLFFCSSSSMVRELLAAGASIDTRDALGRTPLMISRQPEVARALLEGGADVGATDVDGRTALHAAAAAGDHVKLRVLMQHDKPRCALLACAADKEGCTPLHLAAGAASGSAQCLYLLLSVARACGAGADIDCADVLGRTPLLHAVAAGHCSAALYLIRQGAQVACADKEGHTAASIAAVAQDITMLQHLMARGAQLDAATAAHCLEVALDGGESESLAIMMAQHLRDAGHEEQLQGRWLLARACEQRMLDLAACLLRCGVAVDEADAEGNTALHHVCTLAVDQSATLECAQLLLQHDARLDMRNLQGATPLHLAAQAADHTLLSTLLRHILPSTLWALHSHTPTPMDQAAAHHQPRNITSLLAHLQASTTPPSNTPQPSASAHCQQTPPTPRPTSAASSATSSTTTSTTTTDARQETTPSMTPNCSCAPTPCPQAGPTTTASSLLAVVNTAAGCCQRTLLHHLLTLTNTPDMWRPAGPAATALASLLAAGADPTLPDADGNTPLHVAAAAAPSAAMQLLLPAASTPAPLNHSLLTPLQLAASANKWAKVALLLASGAHPEVPPGTPHGSTLLHLAAAHQDGHPAVRQLLLQGADPNTPDATGSTAGQAAAATGSARAARLLQQIDELL